MMIRPKKVKGLCGAYFIQDEETIQGNIHFYCDKGDRYFLTLKYDIQNTVKEVCRDCEYRK